MSDKARVIELSNKTSFRGNDLTDISNIIRLYLDPGLQVCLSCPGSVRSMVVRFKENVNKILEKL